MNVNHVDVNTAFEWIDSGEAILIDVREANEHSEIQIEHSQLIPLSELDNHSLPMVENKKIIVHCHSGRRSHMACQYFIQKHPGLEIFNLDGGILAWAQEGLAVRTAAQTA